MGKCGEEHGELSDSYEDVPDTGIHGPKRPMKNPDSLKFKRQVIKIHGVSVPSEGEWLFAVSFAKSKTFTYIPHSTMKKEYPHYLIGFYERHLELGETLSVNELTMSSSEATKLKETE